MIDKNEMLPNDVDTPKIMPRRTRVSHENVIGIFIPSLPDSADKQREEENEEKQHEKQLKKVAFRAERNIYDDKSASGAFMVAMEEEQENLDEEEYRRRTSRQTVRERILLHGNIRKYIKQSNRGN